MTADTSVLGFKEFIKDIYQTWWSKWLNKEHPRLIIPGSKRNKILYNIKVRDHIGILLSYKGSAGKYLLYTNIARLYKYLNPMMVWLGGQLLNIGYHH